MNHKTNHLSMEELTNYIEKQLQASEVQHVEAHLASGCSACKEELNWLQETLSLMATDDWVDPPNNVVAAVQAEARRFTTERQKQKRSEQPSLLDRLRWLFYPQRLALGSIALTAALLLFIFTGQLSQNMKKEITNIVSFFNDNVLINTSASISHSPLSLANRAQFEKNDFIITSGESGISLRFFQQIVTQLESDTELRLIKVNSELYENKNLVSLFQSSGRSSHTVIAAPSIKRILQIETPVGLIVAENGKFTVIVDSNGKTEVTVFSGRVNVTAQDITTMATSEQTIIVEPKQPPKISP